MNCRQEPVRLKCSEGSSEITVGARPSESREEPVNMSYRQEPVCLKCSEGLVIVYSGSLSI